MGREFGIGSCRALQAKVTFLLQFLFSFFSPVFYSLFSPPKPTSVSECPVFPQADQDQQRGGKQKSSLVWWLFPASVFLGAPESQGFSVRTCLGDDSAQAHRFGADVRAVWRLWQVPPEAFTRQHVEPSTAGRGAILHGHFE